MKMVKKFSILLLVAGSCGVQAYGDFARSEPEIGTAAHIAKHPEQYHNTDMVTGHPSWEHRSPKSSSSALAAKEADAALTAQLELQAAHEGISVAQLKLELKEALGNHNGSDLDGNYTYPTSEEALFLRREIKEKEAQAEIRRIEIQNELAKITPQEIEAKQLLTRISKFKEEFDKQYKKDHSSEYETLENANGQYYEVLKKDFVSAYGTAFKEAFKASESARAQ